LVLPSIYLKFKNHNLTDLFTEELKTHIAGIYLRNKQRNLEILQQADEINRTPEVEGIVSVYLKELPTSWIISIPIPVSD
jgi:hypothetical protein